MSYASLPDLKSYLGVDDDRDDAKLADALESATAEIDDHCHRSFLTSAEATPRRFEPLTDRLVDTDDFWTTDGLLVDIDQADAGTYSTAVPAAGYEPLPLNARPGWPYEQLSLVGAITMPRCWRRAPIRITAKWGWPVLPAPVRQACLIIAAETFKLKDSPFGVGGYGEFGVIRARDNPMAARKLAPYVRDPVVIA